MKGKITIMDDRKNRWSHAQVKENEFWQHNNGYDGQMNRVSKIYKPFIDRLAMNSPDNPVILDVGCGPTCLTHLFPSGLKIYLDPLMSSYVKTYYGRLPEGNKLTCLAETIALGDKAVDIAFCVNALDHMIDPQMVLNEIHRVLKENGIIILGLFLHQPIIAILRRFIDKYLPVFREDAHPYSFTIKSTRKLLKERFLIKEEVFLSRKEKTLFSPFPRKVCLFICGKGEMSIV